jgi:hypothetical protein
MVTFQTNDPTRPDCQIEVSVARVTGGVSTAPPSLAIGTVPLGREVRNLVEIRDTSQTPRTVGHVSSTDPDRVTVRLLPADESTKSAPRTEAGTLIGVIEVVVHTATPGEIRARVEIALAEDQRKPDALEVIGRVVAAAELVPSIITLPRTSNGTPVYTVRCVCRSTDRQPVHVTVDPPPDGFTVELLPQDHLDQQAMVVSIAKDRANKYTENRQSITVRATIEGRETLLTLPVLVRR